MRRLIDQIANWIIIGTFMFTAGTLLTLDAWGALPEPNVWIGIVALGIGIACVLRASFLRSEAIDAELHAPHGKAEE